MIWEIINPSDAYTAEAPDLKIATLASCLLCSGKFPWKSQDGMESTPLCLFGTPWHEIGNITGAGDADALQECIIEHAAAVADALDSVVIGDFADRATYKAAIDAIDDPEKLSKFVEQWHDRKRSSMNDIGTYAKRLAKALRERHRERASQC